MSNPIVEVKHLSHRYSVDWAIRDINFSIEKTGILGLLGSNGAGKSTTMNIICGVLNQTEGDVFINGIDLRKNPAAHQCCKRIFYHAAAQALDFRIICCAFCPTVPTVSIVITIRISPAVFLVVFHIIRIQII